MPGTIAEIHNVDDLGDVEDPDSPWSCFNPVRDSELIRQLRQAFSVLNDNGQAARDFASGSVRRIDSALEKVRTIDDTSLVFWVKVKLTNRFCI